MEYNLNTNISSIEGVINKPLKIIQDERGVVMHMLRKDSSLFKRFGEIYFSEINPGVIKAWKRHYLMTQNFAVPVGRIKLVIYDDRTSSETKGHIFTCELGRPDAYQLVVVPPMVWYGFKGISERASIIANCSDMPHDPHEFELMDINTSLISYEW